MIPENSIPIIKNISDRLSLIADNLSQANLTEDQIDELDHASMAISDLLMHSTADLDEPPLAENENLYTRFGAIAARLINKKGLSEELVSQLAQLEADYPGDPDEVRRLKESAPKPKPVAAPTEAEQAEKAEKLRLEKEQQHTKCERHAWMIAGDLIGEGFFDLPNLKDDSPETLQYTLVTISESLYRITYGCD